MLLVLFRGGSFQDCLSEESKLEHDRHGDNKINHSFFKFLKCSTLNKSFEITHQTKN